MLQPAELSINISTGSQVAMIADDAFVGDFQLRPFFDGSFLKTITNIPAGRALTGLLKLCTEIAEAQGIPISDPWGYIFEQAEASTDSDLEINLAFFPSPVAGPGSLGNLHEANLTIGHVFRAALQQMSKYYEQFATQLAPDRDWSRIVYSGGIAQRSKLLRATIGQRLGKDHRLTASAEDTLLGLMVIARVIAGLDASVQESARHVRARLAEE
jgi:sugar (pentulose or hexulose) kinase